MGSRVVYALLGVGLAVVATFVVWLFQSSPYGRRLRATRDDEMEVRALGYSTVGHQFSAFVLGGALMGSALIAVIAGGRGRLPGVLLGSVLVFGVLNQLTRQLPGRSWPPSRPPARSSSASCSSAYC